QLNLVDFPRRQLRQRSDEDDLLRLFVTGDTGLDELDQRRRLQPAAAAQHDDRAHRFAPFVIRHTDHRAFGDIGVGQYRLLDFARINVFTAGNDHVFLAVDQVQEVLIVEAAHVAGVAPAVAEGRQRGRVVVPVAAHDGGRLDDDFAGLAARQLAAIVIDDLDQRVRKSLAGRTQALDIERRTVRAML